ncbi:hypothetical protein [Chitinophaga filiformis]|nr:hypothetical protein [Chitinophaga filiformis]
MITIQLKDFIKTGNFGPLTIGSSKGEILQVFGGTYDLADCGETQIIKYGWYEFFYWTDNEKIFGIQNDHLLADCVNHSEMINFKNRFFTIDKWFLKENKSITFREVIECLEQENIPYNIVPAYDGCDENIIKCVNSNVTFDFVNEHTFTEVTAKGRFKNRKEIRVAHQLDYVLNGIRLFKY